MSFLKQAASDYDSSYSNFIHIRCMPSVKMWLTLYYYSQKLFCVVLFQLLVGLGYVIFQALDFSIDEEEERAVSSQLERILNFMIQKGM